MSRVLLLALLGFALPSAAEIDPSIVQELRKGGYVLYMRHALTDFSQNDAGMTSYEDCTTQRNLTDKGRAEAQAIGKHLQRLGIPIGEVFASPYCRTMETARLAFGKTRATHEVRGDGLKKLLSSPVPAGKNRAISSHGNPFIAVAGAPYLAEGEIAVVRPEGALRFTVLARIRPADWSSLPGAAGRASSGVP